MIHLSLLLLHLQYRSLFIIYSFFIIIFIIICYSFCIIFPSQLRSNWVNVVFFINNSLIFFAPSSSIKFPVHYLFIFIIIYYYHFVYSFCIIFPSLIRSNLVNVVFFINNLLIFIAPSSPILLSVHYLLSLLLSFYYSSCTIFHHTSDSIESM